jgi:hypothetical protein
MKTSVNKKTGLDLQGKRVALGLTQEELAHKAKVSVACVSMAERHWRLYDTVSGRRLARRLKVPVSELVPLTRARKKKAVAPVVAAVVRPVDFSRGAVLGDPKGIAFQKPIPTAVVAVGSLFARSAS